MKTKVVVHILGVVILAAGFFLWPKNTRCADAQEACKPLLCQVCVRVMSQREGFNFNSSSSLNTLGWSYSPPIDGSNGPPVCGYFGEWTGWSKASGQDDDPWFINGWRVRLRCTVF